MENVETNQFKDEEKDMLLQNATLNVLRCK